MNTESDHERIARIERTIYGDQDSIGMDAKMTEIYETFHGAKVATKTIIFIILTLGGLALAFLNLGRIWSLFINSIKGQ